jgi:hypothetical protein
MGLGRRRGLELIRERERERFVGTRSLLTIESEPAGSEVVFRHKGGRYYTVARG